MALTPRWNYGGSTAYLRIFASVPFYEATTGEFIAQGSPTNPQSFYQQYTCTVLGTTLTIPAVTLATTVDSSVPNAVFTAVIYTSAGAQVYTLLSQFYVDASFFQVTPQSSVLVTGAGSSAANGVFTYRGQSGGYNYYNLQGNADSTTDNVIKRSGADWILTDNIPTTLYRGEFTVDFPWETVWATDGGSLPLPTVAEDTSLMASTWENLTLSQGFGVIPVTYPGPFLNAAATMAYVNSVIANGTTTYANYLVAGITELDVAPASATQPIAIGTNTPTSGTGSLVRATSPALVTANLGTPSAITLTHGTGLPISTGVSGLASGVATFLGTPSSSNLLAALTTKTGTGVAVFGTSPTIGTATLNTPTLTSAVLGTPSSGTLTNCTGLPINSGVSGLGSNVASFLGTPSSANLRAALTDETGTGAAVFGTAPTLSNPTLGTPASVTLTNATGLPVATGISGLGTGIAAFLATPSSANLATAVTNETGSGSLVFSTSCTLVTPILGIAAATSLAATGLIKSSSPTAGIGYSSGSGGAQTQATNKSTTVASNTITTAITMNNAALNTDTAVSFTFTNSSIAATDTVLVAHQSAGTSAAYVCNAFPGSGSAVITVRNVTGGSLSEAIVLRVTVIKSVSS